MTTKPQRRGRPTRATGDHTRYRAPRRAALAPGELRALVEAHLHAHPQLDFTPGEIANVLGRSRGAVINACRRLVALGIAVRTQQSPQRYQATPRPDAPPTDVPGSSPPS